MSEPGQAVFLSYASQDAPAALRLCAALRGAGVEVWFDQSELIGGDVWDRKIREQINSCALFVPLISAHTQARKEGYFRLEWKLAAQRTHMMSERVAFLLPVVIDATGDADADVPAEFRAVQWTRLRQAYGGPARDERALEAFCARVRSLLGTGGVAGGVAPGWGVRDPVQTIPASARPATTWPATPRPASARRFRAWLVLAATAGAGLLALAIWRPWQTPEPAAAIKPVSAPAPGEATPARSIAVLPFANLSADKENEFFADGMHDELLTALAKIGALKVISRTSVLAYRDPQKRNLKQIAAELGVANILEGSVSRAGNRVRIIVQLIDAATDQHRWAETYSRDISDVFQVQADISAQIAQALSATISPELKQSLAHKLTNNPVAYDLYLRARRWTGIISELTYNAKWEELVVAPLEQAVALDPKFAAAYAELSRVHSYLYWFRQLDPTPARLAKAKAAVDMALRLDPSLPVGHSALGYYYYVGSLDFARATEEFAIALAAMPGDADVLFLLALTQRRQGRWAEATINLERAFAINPRNPSISGTWVECLVAQRYYARAQRTVERALISLPANDRLVLLAAWIRFARDGERMPYRSALEVIPPTPEAEPPNPRFKQFREAIDDGRFAEAVRIFDEAAELFTQAAKLEDFDLQRYLFATTAIGERDKARDRALAAIAETTAEATERRDEWRRVAKLAAYHAYAGQPDEARRFADRALKSMPVKRDAHDGPRALVAVAQVHLALGDRDRALALLDQALSVPSFLIANELRLEPWWAPLRDDPRFRAALAKAAPRD